MKKIPNVVPKEVAKNILIKPQVIEWAIDPIQSYTLQLKKQKLPIFAEALSRNLTGLYFQFLEYKVKLKENISIEIKGVTRSGKTTGAISSGKYVAKFTGVPIKPKHVCSNEQYFINAVKIALDNQSLVVDEQLETHVGIGCLSAGHKIFTDIGWVNIEDLESQPERKILSINLKTLNKEWVKDFKFMKYETKLPLYEITIEGGNKLTVTPEHKFPVFENDKKFKFVRAESLKKGDKLRIVEKVKAKKYKKMNPDFAKLVGMLIADGSLSKIRHKEDAPSNYTDKNYYRKNKFYHHAVKFYGKKEEVIKEFQKTFKELYPKFKLHKIKRKRDWMLICNHKKVFKDFSKMIPVGKKSSIVDVPNKIFRADLKSKRSFIRGLYLCDGSTTLKFKSIRGRKISYYSKSEKLCKNIKLLLFEFGIKSQIHKQKHIGWTKKQYFLWHLTITSDIDISNFMRIFFKKDVSLGFNKSNYSNINLRKIILIKKLKPKRMQVYDIEVPRNHNYFVVGILSKNSYREMQFIEDLNNIIAKRCIHCWWIHPPDFVGRNSFYGLETIGRNFEYKITRYLLYDLTQKTFGASSVPLGFVIIPKYNDPEFEKKYEEMKDKHIEALRSENIAVRQQRRLNEGFALARNPLFLKLKNNHQRIQLARNLFPMRTESEYMELISIAKMNMQLKITQKDFDEAKKQVDADMKEITPA